jgi:type IV pilus assembly protein PilN
VLIERKIQEQEAVSNFLQTEIKSLNQSLSEVKRLKQRKQAMIQRLEFINKLQAGRPLVVGTYDELVRIIPQGVYINTISRKGSILIMEGHSESNAQISELMRNAEHSKWFSEPKLQEIKTGNKQKNYKYAFSLKLTLEPRSASKYIRHTVTETKAKQQ